MNDVVSTDWGEILTHTSQDLSVIFLVRSILETDVDILFTQMSTHYLNEIQ